MSAPSGSNTDQSWAEAMYKHTERQTALLLSIDASLNTLKTIAVVVIVLIVAGGVIAILGQAYQ